MLSNFPNALCPNTTLITSNTLDEWPESHEIDHDMHYLFFNLFKLVFNRANDLKSHL